MIKRSVRRKAATLLVLVLPKHAALHHALAVSWLDVFDVLRAPLLLQVMIKQSVRREAESRSHYELLVQVLPPHIIQRLAAGQAYIPEQHEQVG
jgi:hypothetical protein